MVGGNPIEYCAQKFDITLYRFGLCGNNSEPTTTNRVKPLAGPHEFNSPAGGIFKPGDF
jgi:hypothetical protein